MRVFSLAFLASVFAGAAAPAAAQLAITTFGSTDAKACYDDANDGFTADAENCDKALRTQAMTSRDRQATRVNRGIVYNRAGRYADAIADFDAALDDDPDLAEAWLNRGNSLLLTGRADEALENYQAALDYGISKKHVAWYNIGLVYEKKKDTAKAREAFEKALEASPEFALAQQKLAEMGS
ncbi:MAG: tetratricopeptide repeat protein [Amphiplicatus sp.]